MKKTVLVVGSLNMDLVAVAKRLPDKGETVFGESFATFPGGKGANQAVAAGKLGATTVMVGCVGQDNFGSDLLQSLEANHVASSFVKKVPASTGTALITVDAEGSNTIVVIGGANLACSSAEVDQALANIDQPGILLVQNEIPQDTVEYAIQAAKACHWTVILNPAPARVLSPAMIPLIDIVILNETELSVLANCPVNSFETAELAAKKLLADGIGTVILTMGANGSLCCTEEEQFRVKPYAVKAIDTTAAGDAYAGALASSLARGSSLADSLDFASAAAALAVTKSGAQPSLPWLDEVNDFVRKERGRI